MKKETIGTRSRIPLNLQFFAEPPAGNDPPAGNEPPAGAQNGGTGATEIDYEKIASIVSGKAQVAEDTVLKGYFKNQGLSKEEAEQAIATFKSQKAAQQPDVQAIQAQLTQAQQAQQSALVENKAMLMSGELGIDLKTMPYVLKLAELKDVIGTDGAIDVEKLKVSLNKVLEDVPAFKTTAQSGADGHQGTGFRKLGADGSQGAGGNNVDEELANIFGNSK